MVLYIILGTPGPFGFLLAVHTESDSLLSRKGDPGFPIKHFGFLCQWAPKQRGYSPCKRDIYVMGIIQLIFSVVQAGLKAHHLAWRE